MNVTIVESTSLATVAYDDAGELLQLEFCSRAVYQYFGVPAAVHAALLRAPSKGSYFNRVVRGRFPYSLASNAQAGVAHAALRSERSEEHTSELQSLRHLVCRLLLEKKKNRLLRRAMLIRSHTMHRTLRVTTDK